MKKIQAYFSLFLLIVIFVSSCTQKRSSSGSYILSSEERKICDTFQLDTTIIKDLRVYNQNRIEPFHYSLSKIYENGKMQEADPVFLKGIVIKEKNSKSYELVLALKDSFRRKGYTIFLLENNFDIEKQPDYVAVLKTTDQFHVLKEIRTNGVNYDIDVDSLVQIMRDFDKKYSLELIGASGDWCEFIINREPHDWNEFAKEVFKVCPDIVEQGTGSVEALADEMKKTKRLYFWWD
jgi:hypothetical protein